MISRYRHALASGVLVVVMLLTVLGLLTTVPAGAARPAMPNATVSIYLPMLFKPAGPSQVSLKNISYNPNALTVAAGTTVVWTNNETLAIQHTVTSGTPGTPSGVFDSGTLNVGQSFSFTFAAPGTYNYYCRIHGAAMTGSVTVTP